MGDRCTFRQSGSSGGIDHVSCLIQRDRHHWHSLGGSVMRQCLHGKETSPLLLFRFVGQAEADFTILPHKVFTLCRQVWIYGYIATTSLQDAPDGRRCPPLLLDGQSNPSVGGSTHLCEQRLGYAIALCLYRLIAVMRSLEGKSSCFWVLMSHSSPQIHYRRLRGG